MTDIIANWRAQHAARRAGWRALWLGFAIFVVLWILQTPIREIYVPNEDDISTLADALLLAPDARWQDWFTRGYTYLFDLYPDTPMGGGEAAAWGFFRPAYHFLIYLAHFVLGENWGSYLIINCFAVAGMGAAAFQISQTALGLRTGSSLLAAVLVVLSPAVLPSWKVSLAFAINPLATVFLAGAFLAVLARRDFLCLALLFLALLTKENTAWAPLAAAVTVMFRPKIDESLHARAFTAAAMLLPLAVWLGLRVVFFGGIGGTYATAGYTPLADFLKLILQKLTHLHGIFITLTAGRLPHRGTTLLILDRATALLICALISLWMLRILPETVDFLRYAMQKARWPTVSATFLVTLWAAIALAFYLALPMPGERYATSVVVFAWPALVAEVERRGKALIWLGLLMCCVVALTRSSQRIIGWIAEPVRNDNYRMMDAVIRQMPSDTRQIYVVSAGSLQEANPENVRLILGVSAEIVRVVEIDWNCYEASDLIAFDHDTNDGVVRMTVILPSCANFQFYTNRFNDDIASGRLSRRNNTMTYDFTEAYQPLFHLGRKMTLRVRTNGPARFVIENGGRNRIAWFDTP